MHARPLLLSIVVLLVGCDRLFGGAKDSSAPKAASSSVIAASSTPPDAATSADDAGSAPAPSPERLILHAGYIVDESASSDLEIDREGSYKLEQRGDVGSGTEQGTSCKGTLPGEVTTALWKSVDAASFVPAESGYSKAIQAPRDAAQPGQAQPAKTPRADGGAAGSTGQQARYHVVRMLSEVAMVPATEAAARSLVSPIRSAVAAAERQSSSSSACTKLPPRRAGSPR